MENELFYIKGKVFNSDLNIPIAFATIKITDKYFSPITHTKSDSNGNYIIYVKKYSSIIINAVKCGYYPYTSNIIDLKCNMDNFNIYIRKIEDFCNILYGCLYTDCKHYLMNNIPLTLNSLDNNTVYYTNTSECGIFIFSNIKKGAYKIVIPLPQYCVQKNKLFISGKKSFYNAGDLFVYINLFSGTINGVINDIYNNPINNALVLLYNAKTNRPIKATKTNSKGVYLFSNISPGSYYIISKK